VLFILGHFLLIGTIVLWYLVETGRLSIAGVEPINVGIAAIVGYLGAFLGRLANKEEKGLQRDTAQEWRNRKQLIQNVRAAWIYGVRDQALHKSVWLELGLKFEPEQVNRPWHMAWQSGDENQALLEDVSIMNIFRDKAANALLILGEPGSGKTVTLLDLAQQLLDEVEKKKNRDAPIPVVLNLSSWALKRQSLHDWLLAELDTTYGVPKKTGLSWLEQDVLLLFLDGLDEVAEPHRQACVKTINVYRQAHGLTGLAVCSRREEYERLTEKLDLLGAVVIQPLTVAQADDYLEQMGKGLKAVRKFLKEDDALQGWVKFPLFLHVVAMAYCDLSLKQLRQVHTGSLDRLYDEYVNQMLQRHRPHQQTSYKPQQTRKWLAYIASRMVERNLTTYLIEHMQPDWVKAQASHKDSGEISIRLLRQVVGQEIRQVVDQEIRQVVGQEIGQVVGQEKIEINDRQWSWSGAISGAKGGLVVGPSGGLIIGLFFELFGGLKSGLFGGLKSGLFGGLVGGLVFGLVSGLSGGLVGGLVFGLKSGLFGGLVGGLVFGLFGGSAVGGVFGQVFGLGIFARHFALRWLLAHFDYLPFQLVPFLEYAKDRLLLRRVGGGYIFIHRTLMEYFAARDESQEQ
jgi:DNA polymerase III delta prime subunit